MPTILVIDDDKDICLTLSKFLTKNNYQVEVAYKGEDHEHLILLYYKAINYLKMQMLDEALVECRRLNIRLQQLSDRYESENKYKRDAFINMLMGIIYDSNKDYNNAFIAYRNAWEVYQDDYQRLFKVNAPDQLKYDSADRNIYVQRLTGQRVAPEQTYLL